MASVVNLKALGLNYQPNALDLPDGSLSIASNVIIRRDNVIESRRGYKLSGESFGTTTDRITQLFVYKDRILRHYGTTLQFQDGVNNNGTDNYTAFSGSYSPVESGLRMKSVSSSGNMYFTTSAGIKKISAKFASQLSSSAGYIVDAGGIKAIEADASLLVTLGNQTDFFTQDSAVAYRIVWGIKDANDNLVLGAPSQRVVIYNSLLDLLIQDMDRTLGAIDDTCNTTSVQLLQDKNYLSTLKVISSDTATTLRTNLIALAAKLDNDFLYADDAGTGGILNIDTGSTSVISDVLTVSFSSGTATDYFQTGSKVTLTGFGTSADTTTTKVLDGARTVSTVSATSVTFNIAGSGSPSIIWASPTIKSNEYGSIAEPVSVSTPATHDVLVSLQDYLEAILVRLSLEPSTGSLPAINAAARAAYLDILDVTRTAQVKLDISIPDGITTSNFVQVYRSNVTSAEGIAVLSTDIIPNDELKLAYEAFPTSAEISAKSMTITDIVTDTFLGANLYTNAATGEGILQANDVPPLSKDINTFKGYTFYANTQTRQRLELSLLGITNMLSDYALGTIPKVIVSDGSTTNTYSFVSGAPEITEVTTVADSSGSLNDKYFDAYSGEDERKYRFYYNVVGSTSTVSSTGIDEMAKILIDQNDSATSVASKTVSVINRYPLDFFATSTASTFTVSCIQDGYTSNATDSGATGFAITTTQEGRGESVTSKQILLSSNASVGQAVDETARSLVKVINQTTGGTIYAYYLSGTGDVPGSVLLEGRSLGNNQFYLVGNNTNTGSSFNPDLGPTNTITGISVANPTVVTSASHGLTNQDNILILNSGSTPTIDGIREITYINANSFSVAVNVTVGSSTGVFIPLSEAVTSENEAKVGRLYYSKYQQTEAVPALNYLDVGANDKAIIRIFPLRDSLFVFKDDGLYRVSGEVAPFSSALFDATCKLVAPDTLDVTDNLLFGLMDQGVGTVSESGVNNMSRAIDTEILKIRTYDNFDTLSWGIGYDSDNSYTLFTVTGDGKTESDITFRYSTITNTWTNFDKTNTCGIIHPSQDLLYLGAGDTNYIEVERKNFDRYDYADREDSYTLSSGNYYGNIIQLSSVSGLLVGDVVTQTQYVTTYEYNMILKKLDTDPGVTDTNYYLTLNASGGVSLRSKLTSLTTKLDADAGVNQTNFSSTIASQSGSITTNTSVASTVITTSAAHNLFTGRRVAISGSNSTPSINGTYAVTVLSPTTFSIPFTVTSPGTAGSFTTENDDFLDIKACYNKVMVLLNADTGVAFGNYSQNDTTAVKEAIITSINTVTKRVTLNLELEFLLGPLVVFHAIDTVVRWAPITMGDALSLKHIRESTIIFQNKAFSSATLKFASDLLPEFVDIEFSGDGNGIFGHSTFGNGYFGGASNSAPMRTYIPRDKQRCRFLVVEFEHSTAREQYAIYGLSLTGEVTSVRGYR